LITNDAAPKEETPKDAQASEPETNEQAPNTPESSAPESDTTESNSTKSNAPAAKADEQASSPAVDTALDLNYTYATAKPKIIADFRTEVKDFLVDEKLGFTPSGEGEHLYVHIKKCGENTTWIAEKLAKYFRIKPNDVSYSGKKDRHAETFQWFSIYLPKPRFTENWDDFIKQSEANIEILESTRHHQKLRRGTHESNYFEITLRNLRSDNAEPEHTAPLDSTLKELLEQRLTQITEQGVPNYFGEQRFGRGGSNLSLAEQWILDKVTIRNRNKRSLAMSAGRSHLFNLVLSERVSQSNWSDCLEGDVNEIFTADESEIKNRPNGVNSATAPLWGRGRNASQHASAEIDKAVLAPYQQWLEKLEHCGLNQERRRLVLWPQGLRWEFTDNNLVLKFSLASGEFATSVLREICLLHNAVMHNSD